MNRGAQHEIYASPTSSHESWREGVRFSLFPFQGAFLCEGNKPRNKSVPIGWPRAWCSLCLIDGRECVLSSTSQLHLLPDYSQPLQLSTDRTRLLVQNTCSYPCNPRGLLGMVYRTGLLCLLTPTSKSKDKFLFPRLALTLSYRESHQPFVPLRVNGPASSSCMRWR
jgi:hypothetical protein